MIEPQDVALITTILNERSSVDALLASIERQSVLPGEFVVCDGGSTDGTLDLLREWTPPVGVRYSLLEKPGASIAAGRNEAISHASTRWIAVTDAGAELDVEWLQTLIVALDGGADVASGFFVPRGAGFMESLIARVITPTLSEIDGSKFLPSSRSVAFRKDLWASAGGYPEWLDYCEDLVFDLALKRLGAVFEFAPTALVTWAGRPNLKAFAKQYWRYARGDARAGLWPKRHAIRFAAYTVGVVGVALAVRRPVVVVGLLGGAVVYHAKFVRRVLASKATFGENLVLAIAITPIVVTVGDCAKMGGYVAGEIRRVRGRRGR